MFCIEQMFHMLPGNNCSEPSKGTAVHLHRVRAQITMPSRGPPTTKTLPRVHPQPPRSSFFNAEGNKCHIDLVEVKSRLMPRYILPIPSWWGLRSCFLEYFKPIPIFAGAFSAEERRFVCLLKNVLVFIKEASSFKPLFLSFHLISRLPINTIIGLQLKFPHDLICVQEPPSISLWWRSRLIWLRFQVPKTPHHVRGIQQYAVCLFLNLWDY